MVKSYINYLIW